jgi:hypothetical protein
MEFLCYYTDPKRVFQQVCISDKRHNDRTDTLAEEGLRRDDSQFLLSPTSKCFVPGKKKDETVAK